MGVNEIFDVIVGHAREVVPALSETAILPQHSLAQLGANSIDRAEIVMLSMHALSLRFPRVETLGPKNLGELAELLHAKHQAI